MADPSDYAPTFEDLAGTPQRGMVPPPGSAPQPTGSTGPMSFVQAPVAGALEAASNLGSAVEGGARIAGSPDGWNAGQGQGDNVGVPLNDAQRLIAAGRHQRGEIHGDGQAAVADGLFSLRVVQRSQ